MFLAHLAPGLARDTFYYSAPLYNSVPHPWPLNYRLGTQKGSLRDTKYFFWPWLARACPKKLFINMAPLSNRYLGLGWGRRVGLAPRGSLQAQVAESPRLGGPRLALASRLGVQA